VHLQRQQQRHRLLALALLALQVGLVAPGQPAILAGAILVHFGLMLLWQPFWRGSTRVDGRVAMVTVAIATAIVGLMSWLLLGIWLLLLLGLIGGEQIEQRRQQGVQGLVILYLLVALLAGVTPPLFALNGQALHSVVLIAGAIPVALLVLPGRAEAAPAQRFDYLRCLAITGIKLLLLVHNENGSVRFRLSGAPEAPGVDQSA
jgi:MFS family permease